MIRPGIYQKIYIVIVFILLAFIFLGYLMSAMLRDYAFPSLRNPQAPFFARLVEEVNQGGRQEALSQIQLWAGNSLPFGLALVDARGGVIHPPGMIIQWRPSWERINKPSEEFEAVNTELENSNMITTRPTLVRFPGPLEQYLYVYPDHTRKPGAPPRLVYWTMGGVVISILLGIAVSLLFLSRSLRAKIVLADSVIAEIQKGNLKARFPIKNDKDEIAQAMLRFNSMADEIERLVETIQSAEKSRMALLQELTHDLRTPIASMKNLLETLSSGKPIPDTVRVELTSLANKEVHYFERLIEDLLVLAQVSDPKYLLSHEYFNLKDFVQDEAENMASQSPKPIKLKQDLPQDEVRISGDAHLIRRLLRNILDNAYAFAKSEVRICLDIHQSKWARISIEDDGPGFRHDAIQKYGNRRISRVLDPKPGGRLSVGLGTVIVRNIANLHRGSVKPENRMGQGKVLGAVVTVLLPLADKT